MKINKIYVKNLKSIQSLELDLNCKSAIVFGGNNKGKTTALRYLPEVALGEAKKVNGEMVWELNDGSKITYKNGVLRYVSHLQSSNITKELARRLFNQYLFDIDEFLSLTPKKRTEMLLDLFGLKDRINELNERYEYLANLRLDAFRKKNAIEQLAKENFVEPVMFDEQEFNRLKEQLESLISDKFKKHNEQEEKILKEISAKNKALQSEYELKFREFVSYQKTLEIVKEISLHLGKIGFDLTAEALRREFKQKCKHIDRPEEPKLISYVAKKFNPDDDEEIRNLKQKLYAYEEKRSLYLAYKNYLKILKDYETARSEWESLDDQCKKIDSEKKEILSRLKLPKGIEIKENGEIYHNGFPLDKSIISTSQLYIAAMKLASVKMGAVKCITFDASILDKESLKDIINYCNENDLQLLVEKVDFEGGDIVYEIIEE